MGRKEATMATKKDRVRKLTAQEAAIPTSEVTSDLEQAEAALASAAAELTTTGKDGETKSPERLSHPPLTRELFEILRAGSRSEMLTISREGLKIQARKKGSPLTPDDFGQWFRIDKSAPPNLVCLASHEDSPKHIAFESVVMYDDGNLKRDKQFVTDDNPDGIVWRGNFLSVGTENGLTPMFACNADFPVVQKAVCQAATNRVGHDVYVPGQSYAQCLLRIQNIRKNNRARSAASQSKGAEVAAKLAALGGGERKPRQPLGNLGDRAWERSNKRRGN